MRIAVSIIALASYLSAASLTEAAKTGDTSAALRLIDQKADVNAAEVDGTTALHWAVHNNDARLTMGLLKASAKVNVANRYGIAPLAEAAVSGNTEIIAALLKANADVDRVDEDGQTALMLAARTGNVDAVRLLIERGAAVDTREKWRGQTALMWASALQLPEMVKELVAHGANVNARSQVNQWQRDVTAEPRRKYMPLGGLTPLLFASREGCLACAKILVEAGADVNLQDPELVTPVIEATINGHYDVASYLVERGADVNIPDRFGRTALWAVVDMHTPPHSSRPDVVESESVTSTDLLKQVLAKGADVDAPLILYIPYRSLGDRGLDNFLGIGSTPLLRAAKAGDIPAIKWLLEKGADPNFPTITGHTPLMAAAGLGSRDTDSRGQFKTEADALESVKLLLAAGAQINSVEDTRGQRPIHGAAFWGWNSVVQYLADHGAKVDAKDKKGQTPIDSAMGRAGGQGRGDRIEVHEDTAALLKKLMASTGPVAQAGH
jgi:ankyrin repeat protein